MDRNKLNILKCVTDDDDDDDDERRKGKGIVYLERFD